jgi:hypothetical protein
MLSVFMLIVIVLSVIMLSVIMRSVAMLDVVSPFIQLICPPLSAMRCSNCLRVDKSAIDETHVNVTKLFFLSHRR